MSRARATSYGLLALTAIPGCGLGLGGELIVMGTEPNMQEVADASLVETGGDALASNDVNVRMPDRASDAANANAFALDAGSIPAWMRTDGDTDSSSYASVAMDGSSATSASDAFLPDGADQSSDAIADAADDAVSTCARLLQCCDQLMTIAPPPILATCFAQPWDAGEGACDMVLAGFTGAGFCP
jgi:hypothetical protein